MYWINKKNECLCILNSFIFLFGQMSMFFSSWYLLELLCFPYQVTEFSLIKLFNWYFLVLPLPPSPKLLVLQIEAVQLFLKPNLSLLYFDLCRWLSYGSFLNVELIYYFSCWLWHAEMIQHSLCSMLFLLLKEQLPSTQYIWHSRSRISKCSLAR